MADNYVEKCFTIENSNVNQRFNINSYNKLIIKGVDDGYHYYLEKSINTMAITSLVIEDCTLSNNLINLIAKLVIYNQLDELIIMGKKSNATNGEMIKIAFALTSTTLLKKLVLASCQMGPECVPFIVDIINSNYDLKKLDLSYNPLGNSLTQIVSAMECSKIEKLCINGCKVYPDTAKILAKQLESVRYLTCLKMSFNPIGNSLMYFGEMLVSNQNIIKFCAHNIGSVNNLEVFVERIDKNYSLTYLAVVTPRYYGLYGHIVKRNKELLAESQDKLCYTIKSARF